MYNDWFSHEDQVLRFRRNRPEATVPAGSSMCFTGADGAGLDVPVLGLLDRTIEFDNRY